MKQWYLIDAEGKTLGRLSTVIANMLRGKHKPTYSPNADNGDYIIVINASKIVVSGNKQNDKVYRHHTGYAGGLKEVQLKTLLEKKPTLPLEHAVAGMIPRNRLKADILKKLKVYAGPTHDHHAQKPQVLEIAA